MMLEICYSGLNGTERGSGVEATKNRLRIGCSRLLEVRYTTSSCHDSEHTRLDRCNTYKNIIN